MDIQITGCKVALLPLPQVKSSILLYPGKEPFVPLEGRCSVVTPSAVSVLRESSSVCPWLHQELFQECHVNLSYFRDVRNPQESKPFARWPGCSPLCAAGEVLPLFSVLYEGPCSRTPKLAAHLCQEPGFWGRQSSMQVQDMKKDTEGLTAPDNR